MNINTNSIVSNYLNNAEFQAYVDAFVSATENIDTQLELRIQMHANIMEILSNDIEDDTNGINRGEVAKFIIVNINKLANMLANKLGE